MTDLPSFALADGRRLPWAEAILPLLAGFTHEDRDAKGLRAFSDEESAPRAPVHFTASEMVSMHRALLLHAGPGGGKTAFARDLFACLAGERAGDPTFNLERLRRSAYRNAKGTEFAQSWEAAVPAPFLCLAGEDPEPVIRAALAVPDGDALLVVDALERRPDPAALLVRLVGATGESERLRLLVLCETAALDAIRRPAALPAFALVGLSDPERARLARRLRLVDPVSDGGAVAPGPWSLSLRHGEEIDLRRPSTTADATPDDWQAAFADAAKLDAMEPCAVADLVSNDLDRWRTPLDIFVGWLRPGEAKAAMLAGALGRIGGGLPVLLAAGALCRPGTPDAESTARALAVAVEAGGEPAGLRRRAGEHLARLGDPRDLEMLAEVPAGRYPMGASLHPNAAPAHDVELAAFRIGVYPVTVGAYLRFVEATGRTWLSTTGRRPERANHPATDITWHDARAFCAWVTERWRAERRIGADEVVRLPVEREWEAAARGPAGLLYPWGNNGRPEHANDEGTGFNDVCAVGLFPEGRSPAGCLDMAGQAWEWCTTLWGPEMSHPAFAFPWTEDGREALGAPANVRRVLRGGCFSSPTEKANGFYRGSLEPAGFWRGNGFRLVVAKSLS